MNRILLHTGCQCERARRYLERVTETAQRVETIAGGIVETCIPTVTSIMDDGDKGFSLWLKIDTAEPITDLDAAESLVAAQLRSIAEQLNCAAERLEGGAV